MEGLFVEREFRNRIIEDALKFDSVLFLSSGTTRRGMFVVSTSFMVLLCLQVKFVGSPGPNLFFNCYYTVFSSVCVRLRVANRISKFIRCITWYFECCHEIV